MPIVNNSIGGALVEDTGLTSGGDLSINANPTLFDIADGSGWVLNYYSDATNPTKTLVTWSGLSGITITNIATQPRTFVAIDAAGNVIQQTNDYTPSQRRDFIVLGAIIHTDNVNVSNTSTFPVTHWNVGSQLIDLVKNVIGTANVSGNTISANGANLSFDRSAGSVYRYGANYILDKKSPSISQDSAASPQGFTLRYRDGVGGFTTVLAQTAIIPTNWDDGTGVLNTVNGNNWSIFRVFIFNTGATTVQYGQEEYNNLNQARAGLLTEVFETDPAVLENGVLRGYIIARGNTTDLSDTANNIFVEAGKFGGAPVGGTGGITTLQQAYDNSVAPQTILDPAEGGLEIRDNATPLGIGVPLFSVYNSAATLTYLSVDDGGIVAPVATVASGDLILGRDISDSNTLKTYSAQSIADLASGASFISATGGTITTDGNFRIHTFSANDTFEITSGQGSVEYLVIGAGGGGGGGGASAGGGGGGGASAIVQGSLFMGVSTNPLVVGLGGIGSTAIPGGNGTATTMGFISSPGGGGGGSGGGGGAAGLDGACGGGSGASGTFGLGSLGGNGGDSVGQTGGSGGGGYINVGLNAIGVNGGNGGDGTSSLITGVPIMYCGGGGGGSNSATDGVGGAGGGGDAATGATPGQNGTDGTGGGGGGANRNGLTAGNGGAGIVIVRYQFQA